MKLNRQDLAGLVMILILIVLAIVALVLQNGTVVLTNFTLP